MKSKGEPEESAEPSDEPAGEVTRPPQRGIIGRDYREQPAFRPILDSDVELFEPHSREPVRVHNAFWQMLWRQFTLPIFLFLLSLAAVYGLYVWVVDYEEKRLGISSPTENTGSAALSGSGAEQDLHKAMLRTRNPVSTFGVESSKSLDFIAPAPAQEQYCRAAEKLVSDFLEAGSLAEKVKFTSEPRVLENTFLTRYPAVKSGRINFRRLQCVGLAPNATHETYLVEVTLYNFTTRLYRVQHKDREMELLIENPEALLD